jgi:hypothetical protein
MQNVAVIGQILIYFIITFITGGFTAIGVKLCSSTLMMTLLCRNMLE